MNSKISSAIEKITLNAATFSSIELSPTLINFFYGNNGTGKSTIAEAISCGEGLSWQQSKSADDYAVLVYNQEFIDANFRSYGNLKGVFTVGERNIETLNQIAEKSAQRSEQDKLTMEKIAEKKRKENQRDSLLGNFQEGCWSKAKAIREGFSATQTNYKRKAQFAERVLQISSSTKHDIGTLKMLYETAFDPNAAVYNEFQPTGSIVRLRGTHGAELLGKSITSSSDTSFVNFIKAINATDWVRQGHRHYTKTADGKCPYCQQNLPSYFEDEIAACYDKQYETDIEDFRQFQEAYKSDMQGFVDLLNGNLQNALPKLDLTDYKAKVLLLEKMISINIQRISDKLKEPSTVVILENVKTLRNEINKLIETFNQQIKVNNTIVNAKKQNQTECRTKVWELIAFTLQSNVVAYNSSKKKFDDEILATTTQIITSSTSSRFLGTEISELNKQIVSTAPTITSINALLADSGFQGFTLREKQGQQNVYEVVRYNGEVADKLSDGERNFIAFLYFYHLVRGSHNDSKVGRDKIVVIDDPVSSMDSSVLFIVSTLVREMLEVCYGNVCYWDNNNQKDDYIKQMFILTHNVYFHKEISYNQVSRYNCVSFFVVTKTSNISSIKHSVRDCKKNPTEKENCNPIQNSYAALWSEYKELNSPITVLNVIRRILEYYFIQLCGYEGQRIQSEILEANKDKFIDDMDKISPDYTRYHLASAMLSYINVSTLNLEDGLYYVDNSVDVSQFKEVFKLIFETLEQKQHYNMMMGQNW